MRGRPKTMRRRADRLLETVSKLDFAHSGRLAGDENEPVQEAGGDFSAVPVIPGRCESRRGPEFAANQGESIAEGGIGFAIPADAFRQEPPFGADPVRPECDQG